MTYIPGLVSITFRKKTPLEICRLCQKAALRAVEWGGDVHVPPEKPAVADEVRAMSADHGLEICSYGSYYRLGQDDDAFARTLEAAARLGAPVLRLWAGTKGSKEIDEAERAALIDQLHRHAEKARKTGVTLACEYHGQTLTDARASARRLLSETADIADAFSTYWQPRWDWSEEERLASLRELGGRLSHVHVFTWRFDGDAVARLPLSDGEAAWKRALAALPEGDRRLLIEFVRDDADESLLRDANTLKSWL